MSGRPVKPPQIAFSLYKHGNIEKVSAAFKYTSADDGDSYLIVWHSDNTRREIRDPSEFYEVAEWFGCWPALFRLKDSYRAQVEAFQQWELTNAAELATYKRLKAKFATLTTTPESNNEQ